MIDKMYISKLNQEAINIDPENEILYNQNFNKRLNEFSKNLKDTIEYLNSCDENELDWASECFDELSEHFKSMELIDCIEKLISKCKNNKLKEQLKTEVSYMKTYLQPSK